MSIWDFLASVEGYRQANDPDADKRLNTNEQDQLWDFITSS
jgi:hypothetical protein